MTISDIVNSVYFKTKTNSASFVAADMLILINRAYNRVTSLIMQADGRWQWDDTNNTDFPIATASLVTSQQDYALAAAHLKILRIEVKDTSGNWRQLAPFDNADYEGQSITQLSTQTGVPNEYDKLGTSIFLLPVPNYSQASSLKIYYQRGPAEYSSAEVSTGTKSPGFNSLYHELIPLWVAYDYAIANEQPQANGWMQEIIRLEQELKTDYGKRDKDERPILTMKGINFF